MNLPYSIAYNELRLCQDPRTQVDAIVSHDAGHVQACMCLHEEDRAMSIIIHLSQAKEAALLAHHTVHRVRLHPSFRRSITLRADFYNTMLLLLPEVRMLLATKHPWKGRFDVVRISGYSVAGSIAHILGLFLRMAFPLPLRIEIFSFGAPMFLGNDGYTVSCISSLQIASHRVVLSEDPMAMLGPAHLVQPQGQFLYTDGSCGLLPRPAMVHISFHSLAMYMNRLKVRYRWSLRLLHQKRTRASAEIPRSRPPPHPDDPLPVLFARQSPFQSSPARHEPHFWHPPIVHALGVGARVHPRPPCLWDQIANQQIDGPTPSP